MHAHSYPHQGRIAPLETGRCAWSGMLNQPPGMLAEWIASSKQITCCLPTATFFPRFPPRANRNLKDKLAKLKTVSASN